MNTTSKLLAVSGTALLLASAQALPLLQLDIGGGTYVGGNEQTTYATASPFRLYALYDGSRVAPGAGTYFISAAIEPRQEQGFPPPNVGSFSINGVEFTTANMNYGTPPVQVTDGMPGVQDLGAHGQYPTYYAEVSFSFAGAPQSGLYNTATDPGDPLSHPGTGLYYQEFLINVSGLLSAYSIHFDLYDTAIKKKVGTYTLDDFAPFSHDAQSGPGGRHDRVPDGGATVALLGLAFAALGAGRRLVS